MSLTMNGFQWSVERVTGGFRVSGTVPREKAFAPKGTMQLFFGTPGATKGWMVYAAPMESATTGAARRAFNVFVSDSLLEMARIGGRDGAGSIVSLAVAVEQSQARKGERPVYTPAQTFG